MSKDSKKDKLIDHDSFDPRLEKLPFPPSNQDYTHAKRQQEAVPDNEKNSSQKNYSDEYEPHHESWDTSYDAHDAPDPHADPDLKE